MYYIICKLFRIVIKMLVTKDYAVIVTVIANVQPDIYFIFIDIGPHGPWFVKRADIYVFWIMLV